MSQSSQPPSKIDPAAKREIEQRNEAALMEDLWTGRLQFQSRPREIELQLTNFCNMSCTMCYDGKNPPRQDLPQKIVEHVAEHVLPTASVLVPGAGTEPLILTWEATRSLAEAHGMEIYIVTNLQFLDEQRFRELEPHVSMIVFSVDSHVPGIYERIRLRSKPKKVFENLPRAARLCAEAGIEVQANAVFMVENAPYMDETVAYLADAGVHTVRLLKFHDYMTGNRFLDAEEHLSAEWLAWMKDKIRAVAAEKQIRVVFDLREKEVVDHLPKDLELRSSRKYPVWMERLRRFYPGYCYQAAGSTKVDTAGRVYPCCVGTGKDLLMGDLRLQSFEEIWNGPPMQDLRRRMIDGDLPEFCQTCAHVPYFSIGPQEHMAFVDGVVAEHLGGAQTLTDEFVVDGPEHLARLDAPPRFSWQALDAADGYFVALTVGGELHPDNHYFELDADCSAFEVPAETWDGMQAGIAWWWTVWARTAAGNLRNPQIRCLRRKR